MSNETEWLFLSKFGKCFRTFFFALTNYQEAFYTDYNDKLKTIFQDDTSIVFDFDVCDDKYVLYHFSAC